MLRKGIIPMSCLSTVEGGMSGRTAFCSSGSLTLKEAIQNIGFCHASPSILYFNSRGGIDVIRSYESFKGRPPVLGKKCIRSKFC